MAFNELETAMNARKAIVRIVERTVNRMRPEPKLAEVYDFNTDTMMAEVLLPGDTQPLRARLARGQIPTHKKMDDPEGLASGDIVRLAGKSGAYYILCVYGVAGSITKPDSNPVGVILEYSGGTAPAGYLLCQGQFVLQADYADLFAVLGHVYNGGTDPADGTFKIPDRRDRAGIGSSGSHLLGTTGGSATKVIETANLPAHTHTVEFQWQADAATTGSGNRVTDIDNQTGGSGTSESAQTSSVGSATPLDVQNPYISLNYIIKY